MNSAMFTHQNKYKHKYKYKCEEHGLQIVQWH